MLVLTLIFDSHTIKTIFEVLITDFSDFRRVGTMVNIDVSGLPLSEGVVIVSDLLRKRRVWNRRYSDFLCLLLHGQRLPQTAKG